MAQQLLDSGISKLSVRERQVIARVMNRHTVSRPVNQAFEERRSVSDRLAGQAAAFGGSWTFIILALLNSALLTLGDSSFDPYPFIFLNLILNDGCSTGPHHHDVTKTPDGQGPTGCRSRLRNQSQAELEIMGLHKKMEEMQVEHIGRLLQLGQEQCRLLQLLADGRINPCASEASGTVH